MFVTTEPTTTRHRVLFHTISDEGSFTNVRSSNKLREANFRLWLMGISIFWLVVLGGCKARQLVRTTPQMDAEPQFWVRVLLLDDVRNCMLEIHSSFAVLDSQTNTTQAYFDRLMVPASVSVSGGKIVIAGRPFAGSQATILPGQPHIFNLNGDNYRGKLVLILNPDGDSLDAINIVPLEPYLAGVVGAEMPDYWEPAALEAQAIAARTYCLYIKRRFGGKRSWDVTRTAANQVYLGVKAESAPIWDAVERTHGQVLVCRQAGRGEDIFPSYYSSTCGGHTENSKNVFGDSFTPLVGVLCPYCKEVAKPNFFFWPMVQFDKTYVTSRLLERYPKLKQLGGIESIIPARQSKYEQFSRLTLVKLLDSAGKSGFLRAEDLRLVIDPTGRKLKSTICQIISVGDKWAFLSGRGYGHGVGMCQCGAQALARRGRTARQILFYYYPNSNIISVY